MIADRMLLRRLTFTRPNSTSSAGGFNAETFKEDFTGNCKSGSSNACFDKLYQEYIIIYIHNISI